MKRTELARGKPLGRGKRLKLVSERRRAEADDYLDACMLVNARDGGRCQAERIVAQVRCWDRLDPHHVHPTGDGGPRCDPVNIVTLCGAHHLWVHADKDRSFQLGLLAGTRRGVTVTPAEAAERRAALVR